MPFTIAGYNFCEKTRAAMPKGYEWPELSDMKMTAIASVGFAILEIVTRKVAYIFFVPYCKEQKDITLQELRSGKAAFCIYKAFYFVWATWWGYIVLKD